MGTITSGIGLVSGINTRDIIDQLIALESRPKTLLQNRINSTNAQKLAYSDIAARLSSLRLSALALKKPSLFQQSTATSSNENVITASTSSAAVAGTFQFQVARLVSAQQSISNGFADSSSDKVGAGALTVEMGGGEINSQTLLSRLNGGAGVRQGIFRITDASGKSGVIDVSQALTVDDVLRKINSSLDVSVKAKVTGDGLTITDLSGGVGNIVITDLGDGHAAADLGLAGTGPGGELVGTDINFVGRSTLLADLNDGRGVRDAKGAPDFQIQASDGSQFDITVKGIKTVGELFDAINTATAGKVTASAVTGENGIRLSDNSGGGGTFAVAALNGSRAAADLGIEQTASGTEIDGNSIVASINTVLLSSLRGGQGLTLGQVSITDRSGASATLDLTTAKNVQDVISAINNAGIGVLAELKASGNGIQISDNTGASGDLVISDVDSTTAAELGISGTFSSAVSIVKGANLQKQWVNENTLLSKYNGGKAVARGKFKITNSAGVSATVDLTQGNETTLDDVITEINAKNINVTASINANGDGLLLTDSAGGPTAMKVEEVDGTTATDLNIKGTAVANAIDGTFEKTLTIAATDTLDTVVTALNALGFGVNAGVINDSTGNTPFRLSLTAKNTGVAGRVIFDAGDTRLQTRNLVEAQDAAIFVGGAGAIQPLIVTSSSNQITGVIKGLTLDLHAVSTSPVTVSVSSNGDGALAELKKFVDSFNAITDKIGSATQFDPKTNSRGLLLGDSTAQIVQQRLFSLVQSTVAGLGNYKNLSQLGLKINDGAKLEIDEDKFNTAYAADPESIKKLFTTYVKADTLTNTKEKKGLGTILDDGINSLIDPATGLLTRENKSLDNRTDSFQDRIDQLDKLLEAKRARLERQFASMESVLAGLQSQQQALSSFTPVQPLQTTQKSS